MAEQPVFSKEPEETALPCPPIQSSIPPTFQFDSLAGGAKEILIVHQAQVYRLRVTKNGKLILNK